jgi:hypothetical protein
VRQQWLFFALFYCALVACSKAPEPLTVTPKPLSVTATRPPAIPTITRRPSRSPIPTATQTSTPTATPIAIVTGTFDIKQALSALYAQEGINFTSAGVAQLPAVADRPTVTLKVLLAAPYVENQTEKYVLITGLTNYWGDCSSCPISFRTAIFIKHDNRWEAEFREDDDYPLGFNGQAPLGQLVKIGPDRYSFLFLDTFSGQNYSQSALVLYVPTLEFLKQMALIPYFSEHVQGLNQSKLVWGYESVYQFIPGADPEYYDLQVTTTGSKVVEGKLVSANKKQVYPYDPKEQKYPEWYLYRDPPTPSPTPFAEGSFTLRKALETLYLSYPGAEITDQNVVHVPEVYTYTGCNSCSGCGANACATPTECNSCSGCKTAVCEGCETCARTITTTWSINPILVAPFVEANVQKWVVLTEWAGFERGGFDGCHLCGAGIGGGIFAKVGNNWMVETKNISNTVDTIGSWGHAPDGQLIQIGPNKYGFLFFEYYGGQGYSANRMHVYTNIAGELKQVIAISEFDEVMPYSWADWLTLGHQSIYRFVPGSNPAYYDLQVIEFRIKNAKAERL